MCSTPKSMDICSNCTFSHKTEIMCLFSIRACHPCAGAAVCHRSVDWGAADHIVQADAAHIYIYIYIHTYTYIYIYKERERERKRDICIYIYIYSLYIMRYM